MINVFQPSLGQEEAESVQKVFASNWVGRGKITETFETLFAAHIGVPRQLVRSITCCTEGLFQAIEAMELNPGDEVILPSISFVGAGNAVAASGARPIFCDVDPRSLNATADHIEQKISPKTKAVLLTHYGGLPAEMDPILELLREKNLFLIEDSACSVSSRYKGKSCGTFGDFGVWSFDAMKILVTGDGGMIYTKTEALAKVMEHKTYLGLETNSGITSSKDRWWEFDISSFGRRAILNDITSSIGLVQLKKLKGFIDRRRAIHKFYDRELAVIPWLQIPPEVPNYSESSYYFYWVQTDERDRFAMHLKKEGIYTTFRYYPLHKVKKYECDTPLANSELAAQTTLCIPLHQSLSDSDINHIVEAIRSFNR
jgi:aminotransferase